MKYDGRARVARETHTRERERDHLKLVTQTERMPASAAALQATGTTSDTYTQTDFKDKWIIKVNTWQNSSEIIRDKTCILLKKLLKIFTTKSALMDFSHSTSVAKIVSRGTTAVSEY